VGGLVLPEHIIRFNLNDGSIALHQLDNSCGVIRVDMNSGFFRRTRHNHGLSQSCQVLFQTVQVYLCAGYESFRTITDIHFMIMGMNRYPCNRWKALPVPQFFQLSLSGKLRNAFQEVDKTLGAGVNNPGFGENG